MLCDCNISKEPALQSIHWLHDSVSTCKSPLLDDRAPSNGALDPHQKDHPSPWRSGLGHHRQLEIQFLAPDLLSNYFSIRYSVELFRVFGLGFPFGGLPLFSFFFLPLLGDFFFIQRQLVQLLFLPPCLQKNSGSSIVNEYLEQPSWHGRC